MTGSASNVIERASGAAAGLLGGSFDPVHEGHVALAMLVQDALGFDPLWVVPSKSPPHKAPFAIPDSDRLAMVQLAFESVPGARISKVELERPGNSYALHTIHELRARSPETPFFFVMGADAFLELPQWHGFPEVMEACSYLVVSRAGAPSLALLLGDLERAELLERQMPAPPPFVRAYRARSGESVCILDARLPEVSSTEVRLRLQLGETVSGLVPPEVERYLITRGPYGSRGEHVEKN